jgi:hypothetical protein
MTTLPPLVSEKLSDILGLKILWIRTRIPWVRIRDSRWHELGDEPKQIRDLHHLPQRTPLEVLTLTLVSISVSDSDSVLVLVWILIEGSVMEGEPLGQSLTTTEKRGERRRSEGPNTELRRREERPSTSSPEDNKLSPPSCPSLSDQEGKWRVLSVGSEWERKDMRGK